MGENKSGSHWKYLHFLEESIYKLPLDLCYIFYREHMYMNLEIKLLFLI